MAPRVDGHLDDAAWSTIPANDTFTQSFPNDGAVPSGRACAIGQ